MVPVIAMATVQPGENAFSRVEFGVGEVGVTE
jgi:hypothetical protein